jgi:ankyrin repeat protein
MDMCRFTGLEDIEYKKVDAALRRMANSIFDTRKDGITPLLDSQEKQKLLDSLNFDQIDARQMNIKRAHAKTCKWLLKKSEYHDWLDPTKLEEHHGFLWIKGKPGAGKSTLMKFALTNSRKSIKDTIAISFFFNARGESLEKSTVGMYRSLLLQLLEKIPELLSIFDSLAIRTNNGHYQWTLELLKECLEQAIYELRHPVLCFVDALDECDERQIREMVSFFEQIGELAVSARTQFRVCFSSRHYPYVTIYKALYLILEGQEGHNEDITNFLSSELRIGDSEDAEIIQNELQNKASGVFMWIVLVVEILNKEYDRGRIHTLRRRLQEIPSDLHALLHDMLTRDKENKNELLLCIQWILLTKEALRPEQLYFAILASTEPEFLSAWESEKVPMDLIKRRILYSSKGVAEVTRSKVPTVQFIHESVRDFLLKENGLCTIWPELGDAFLGKSHEELKRCCLNYMKVNISAYIDLNMELPKASDTSHLRSSLEIAFPFLKYAVENVLYHANLAEAGGISQSGFIQNFRVVDWIKLDNIFETFQVRRHNHGTSLLYILAEKNLSSLIRIHPSRLEHFDIVDARYGPPLLAAFANGSKDAIQSFMEERLAHEPSNTLIHEMYREYGTEGRKLRSNINFTFSKRKGLILNVAEYGNDFLLTLLLTTESLLIESKHKFDSAVLYSAALTGCFQSINILLSNGTDVNAHGRYYGNALQAAAFNGHEKIVELLLHKGADVNAQGGQYMTALHAAVFNSHEKIVELLLHKGADVNAQDGQCGTALHAAVSNNHEKIVELLLHKGADVNEQGGHFGNALQAAVGNGYENITELLLHKGADVNAQCGQYRTALHAAVSNHHEKIVELLLHKGADVNAQCGQYRTALHAAVFSGHENITELLLHTGADVNAQGGHFGNALQAAAVNGNEKIVKLLLHTGADINAQGGHFGNALQAAVFYGYENITELLLHKGADVNAQGGHCGNALQAAIESPVVRFNIVDIVDRLLSAGANPNAGGGGNGNALQAIRVRISQNPLPGESDCYEETIRLLLDKGATDMSNTPLGQL